MSETSAAVPRDRLADMTRERDWWRRMYFTTAVLWAVHVFVVLPLAPHIERAWLAWRAEPVRAQVQCMDPVRVINDMPPSRIIYDHPTGKVRPPQWNAGTTIMPDPLANAPRCPAPPGTLCLYDRSTP